jgi:hypothetical protein
MIYVPKITVTDILPITEELISTCLANLISDVDRIQWLERPHALAF